MCIRDRGLAVKVEGTKVFLGGHYYNSSYGYISSTGGNNNSIGMETSGKIMILLLMLTTGQT